MSLHVEITLLVRSSTKKILTVIRTRQLRTKIASGVYVVFVSREPPPNTANRVIRDQVKSDSSSVEMKMKGLEEENSALKAKNISQEAELIRLREEKKNLESELIRLK